MRALSLTLVKFPPRELIEQGSCTEMDADLFFPHRGDDFGVRRAKAICRNYCPVIAECLEYALENDERHGVWGGTSADDRRQIRREGKAA